MEMHQIRYFLAVCETFNFTRAAERCNVTQPALTRAIQKLEVELGGLLFRRERNQTHLTDLGQLVKPRLEAIHDQTDQAQRAAKDFLKLDHAAFRLGIMCTIGPVRFMPFLDQFRRKHPGIDLTLIEGVPAQLEERMKAGEIDVSVMARPDGFDPRCDVHPLYRERFMIALPKGHRLAAQAQVSFADLDGESYLQRVSCEYLHELRELREKSGSKMKLAYASEREDWIMTMVAAGLGVCMLPQYSATLQALELRPLVDPPVSRTIALVTLAGRRFSPAVKTFVQAIKAYRWPESDGMARMA
jgi:LysR family hydrogen peroxide-inducible transcriptional activator